MIDMEWDENHQNILLARILEGVTWETYRRDMQHLMTMVAEREARVDVILIPVAKMIPGNPLPHLRMVAMQYAALPNAGMMVVVSNIQFAFLTRLIQVIMQIYLRQDAHRFPVVQTIEEAYTLIEEQRPVVEIS